MSRRKQATTPAPEAAAHPAATARAAKITCVLLERHAAYLDVVAAMIRMRHHKAITRSGIVRAFVEFMEKSGVDYSQFASVAGIVDHVTRHFRKAVQPAGLPPMLEASLFQSQGPSRAAEDKTR